MKNLNGIIYGAILGFIFVVACITPVNSEETEIASSMGKYQVSTSTVTKNTSNYYYETILDTETGEVISR